MRRRASRAALALSASLLVATGAGALAAAGDHDEVRDMSWPLDGTFAISDDYDSARGGNNQGCTNGRVHQAIDIMAPKLTPVHAAMGGQVVYLPEDQPSYGWIVIVAGDDGLEYSYVHLNNDNPGTDDGEGGIEQAIADDVRRGAQIERGQLLGWVGDSGSAETTGSHLHLDIEDTSLEDSELQCPYRGDRLNPYPSLVAALERGDVPGSITPLGGVVEEDPNPPVPDGWTWADVDPAGVHATAVAVLTDGAVLDGCSETRYCPSDELSRRDMARFLARALGLEPAAATFTDVAGDDPDAGWIGAVVAADVAEGLGDGTFQPDATVTRAQMAMFLTNGFRWAPAPAGFADVADSSPFRDAIGALVAAGITEGCGDGASFCGTDPVTRGQIASFLARAG
jgi:hypothetical protein